MKIRTVTIAQLSSLINDSEFWKSPVLPISKHRAISQVNNPHAADNDVCLIAAVKENRIVSYIGIIPQKIYYAGEVKKIGLLSCWWADPKRAGISALAILYKALSLWNEDVFVSEFSPSAKVVFDKTEKFNLFKMVQGTRFFIRFNFAEILPPKINAFSSLKPLLNMLDNFLNFFLIPTHTTNRNKKINSHFVVEYLDFIDDETNKFILKYNSAEIFNRSKPEFDWILKFPWILESNLQEDEFSKKYFYSSIAKKFKNRCLKINYKNEIIAFIFLTQRNNHFKMPYFYYNPAHKEIVIQLLIKELLKNNATMFTVYNCDNYFAELNHALPFIHKRKVPRLSYISKNIKGLAISSLKMQDGDADCAFT